MSEPTEEFLNWVGWSIKFNMILKFLPRLYLELSTKMDKLNANVLLCKIINDELKVKSLNLQGVS